MRREVFGLTHQAPGLLAGTPECVICHARILAAVRAPDIPNIGRFAMIVDPQGAVLGILQPAPGM